MSVTLEAATLPIRGQEEKSAFGAMNGWCDAMPYVAGNYGDRYSVRSRFRRSQSSCSTHMYNCRRARFGSVWGSCVGHPPASSSGHFALASRWSLGGPFAVYPNKVKAQQMECKAVSSRLSHNLQVVSSRPRFRVQETQPTSSYWKAFGKEDH